MSAGRAFFKGVVATATALLVVFGARSLVPSISFPPARLASLLVRVVPGDFATAMIERLGPLALRGLAAGVNVAVVAAGGLLGVWIARGSGDAEKARRAAGLAAALFTGSLLLAVGDVGGLSLSAVVAYLLAVWAFASLAAGVPLLAAVEPNRIEGNETPLDAIARSRRRFVVRAAWALGGLLAGGSVIRALAVRRGRPAVQIAAAARPYSEPAGDNFPAIPGQTREITPIEDFYNVDINIVKPVVDQTEWKLSVGGLVDKPYELTYRQLQEDFEIVEMAHTLTCISNEVGGDLISTAIWRGVRLKDVLDRAGLQNGIVDIVFRGEEGYSDSIRLEEALQDDTLVVFGMNGVALPRVHGFPARIIVPNIYGMKNVKWLTSIEAVDSDYQGYWMVRGWDDEAVVKTQSRFDVPSDTATVQRGARLAGVAWAGDRGIRRVEISTDRGQTWEPAVLKRELSNRTWRLWAANLDTAPGRVRVMVRAVDGEGGVQSGEVAKPHPSGAGGYHSLDLTVR
ncbi:MAG TPA: molybdopterin-dependent oxidoreductase [Actinomycetota bacterium]|nr:molybdopterin-dependent oxidoreductase [Actinomycetota bacterium]